MHIRGTYRSRATITAVATAGLLGVTAASEAHQLVTASSTRADDTGFRGQVAGTLGLEQTGIVALDLGNFMTAEAPLMVVLPVADQMTMLYLEPHDIYTRDARILEQQPDGSLVELERGPLRTMRGTVLGVAGSTVAASMLDDGLHASIRYDDGSTVWVEPIAARVAGAGAAEHAVYLGKDVIADGACGTTAAHDAIRLAGGVPRTKANGGSGGSMAAGGACVAELAIDTDNEYYGIHGAGTANAVEIVINAVNLQYEAEVGITHLITDTIVRSGGSDPYSSTTDAVSILNELRNHWNSTLGGIQRDTVQLFTGKSVDGSTIGIAWLNAICSDYGYSMVQSDFSSAFASKTDLSAHELGHNWGADHCQCYRPRSYTMNSFITSANTFHPSRTVPDITAFRDSIPCLDGCGGVGPVCGDGVCEAGEDAASCPGDCPLVDEICNDGVDNDGDGAIDCADGDCAGDPACDAGTTSSVHCITWNSRGGPAGDKRLEFTIAVVNESGNPVVGATVSGILDHAGGGSWTYSATTGSEGTVDFVLGNGPNGCYTTTVTDITAGGGLQFDGLTPTNGFDKGNPGQEKPDADCRAGGDTCG